MIKMKVKKTLRWNKDSIVQPSLIEYNMKWRAKDWNKDIQDMAIRIWQQIVLMPYLTGEELLNIVSGKWKVNIIDAPKDTHYKIEFYEEEGEEE